MLDHKKEAITELWQFCPKCNIKLYRMTADCTGFIHIKCWRCREMLWLKPDSFRASVLKGMMHFVELYHGEFSEERLLRALRNIHPVDIYRIGQDDPAKLRGWKKYVFPIYTAYNGKCRKDALPMKF